MDEWVVRIDAKLENQNVPLNQKKDTKRRLSIEESFSFVWITEVYDNRNNHEPHEVHSKQKFV